MGLKPITSSISAETAYRVGAILEVLWKILPGEPPMTRFVARELATSHWYDIGAAKQDLGYQPIVDIEKAWIETISQFKTIV